MLFTKFQKTMIMIVKSKCIDKKQFISAIRTTPIIFRIKQRSIKNIGK